MTDETKPVSGPTITERELLQPIYAENNPNELARLAEKHIQLFNENFSNLKSHDFYGVSAGLAWTVFQFISPTALLVCAGGYACYQWHQAPTAIDFNQIPLMLQGLLTQAKHLSAGLMSIGLGVITKSIGASVGFFCGAAAVYNLTKREQPRTNLSAHLKALLIIYGKVKDNNRALAKEIINTIEPCISPDNLPAMQEGIREQASKVVHKLCSVLNISHDVREDLKKSVRPIYERAPRERLLYAMYNLDSNGDPKGLLQTGQAAIDTVKHEYQVWFPPRPTLSAV